MNFTKDFDELVQERLDYLRTLEPELDIREGSIAYDITSAGALAVGRVLFSMDALKNMVFAETATGEYLDYRVNEIGIKRMKGAKATGFIEVTGLQEGDIIPMGSRFSDINMLYIFESTEDKRIEETGSTVIPIRAMEEGTHYNLLPNTIVMALGDFMDILDVVNHEEVSGGVDLESDESLYERYVDKLSHPPISGNANQIRQWAMEIPTVGRATVERLWQGAGTARVFIMTSDYSAPTSTLVSQVQEYLNDDERVPIGAQITVQGVTEQAINITAKVQLRPGFSFQQAQQEYKEKTQLYFKDIAMLSDTVQQYRFVYMFMDMESVFNFSDLTINGGSQDILLEPNEIPTVGSVIFNAI